MFSGSVFASSTKVSMHGGQQNSYFLPAMIQVQLGLALVNVMGQILSPEFGLRSCGQPRTSYFCDGVKLPLALMSASVYLPPGVKKRVFSSAPTILAGISSSRWLSCV